MRESLTILAIAIIAVLSVLLVGPYLVDWSGQREWLAAKLSKSVGATVRIAGPIDVKLLPRPIFRAAQVSVEGRAPGEPRFSAERLDAELSINGLLQGAVEFVDATLASPRITVTMRPDGAIVAPPFDLKARREVQFRHVAVENGALAVVGEDGRERFALGGIAAEGEAETLLGPVKFSGSARTADGTVSFRLNTGAYDGRRLRVGLVLEQAGAWTRADLDGQVAFASADAGRASTAAFAGNISIAGSLHVADGASPVPWMLAATAVAADPQSLAAPTVELRAGADNRALVANGGVLATFGSPASATVKLHARQLDVDRIAVPPEVAPDTPRPRGTQWFAALRRVLDGALPIGLTLDAAVDAVTAGDVTLTDAAVTVETRVGAPGHATVAVSGPDGTRIALDGALGTGPEPRFDGRADISTRDLATLAGLAEPFLPGLSDSVARGGLAGRAFALKGAAAVSATGASVDDAVLTLAGTVLRGRVAWTPAAGTDRPRLSATIDADAVEPDGLPDGRSLASLLDPVDLAIGLRSDAVRLGRGDSEPGRLALHLTKTGQAVTLDRFDLAGFGGASITGTASLDGARQLRASGQVAAPAVAPLAAFVEQMAPGSLSTLLARRAVALSPLALDGQAEAALDDAGSLKPQSFTGSGMAGATRFAIRLAPRARGAQGVEASLTLDAPEGSKVLAQAGLDVPGPLGALRAKASGQGSLADGFDATADATVSGAKLAYAGRVGTASGRGRGSAEGTDAATLLRGLGLGRPGATGGWTAAADLSWNEHSLDASNLTARLGTSQAAGTLSYAFGRGDAPAGPLLTGALTLDAANIASLTGLALAPQAGALSGPPWSGAGFGPMPAWPTAEVRLKIGSLDLWPGLQAHDAVATLELRPNVLTLADAAGRLLNGSASGSLTLRRNGPGASLSGQIAADGLRIDLPSLGGRLSGALSLAGTGTSPVGLVGSLAGDGSLKLAGATTLRLDPAALGDVAKLFDRDDATIDQAPVAEKLGQLLDRSPLALSDLSGTATIAAGVLRMGGLPSTVPEATATTDAAFDLEALTLGLRTTLVATTLPKDWKGDPPRISVAWAGPLLSPSRTVDTAALVNGLAARAIQREQDRIELMKDDLRERAFFARRLKAIEAEQQAARDAVQIQRMVPQPPPRPGDIRLPKPPDVGPPTVAPPASAVDSDALKALIESGQGKDVPQPPSRPIDLTRARRPGTAPLPPLLDSNPAQPGLY